MRNVPQSPLRSPPHGQVNEHLYASQTLSEVSEIEEELEEGGLEEEHYHTAGLKPVAIRPMRLSPDFFTGFGRAAHRSGAHSRGSTGSPVTPGTPVTPGMADDKPQLVLPGLFIGALEAARNATALRAAGIEHILTLGLGMDLPKVEKQLASHRVVAVEDKASESTSLARHMQECIGYIDECRAVGGKVLVHCLAGRSRSASIVAAYIMVQHKCGVDEALSTLRAVRPWIAPNKGFLDMLRAFQDQPTFVMPQQADAPPPSSSEDGRSSGRNSVASGRAASAGSRGSSGSGGRGGSAASGAEEAVDALEMEEAGEAQEAGAGEEDEAGAAQGDVVSHALQMTPRVSEEEPPPVARAQPQPEADAAQDAASGAKGRRREAQAAEQPAPHSGRLERRRARG